MKLGSSLSDRLSFWLILLLGVIFTLTAALDYSYSKENVLTEARLKIREEVKDAIYKVESLLTGVQKTTDQLGIVLGYSAITPQLATTLLKDLVEGNTDVSGAAIALEPKFVGHEEGFATYYYRDSEQLKRIELSGRNSESENDVPYYQEHWYKAVKEKREAVWSEPYFDTYGAGVAMVTYSVPVFQMASPMLFEDQNKTFIGVVTGDIAVSTLQSYLDEVKVGETGFVLLASQLGTLISFPEPKHVMKSLLEVYPAINKSEEWKHLFGLLLSGEQGVYRGSCYKDDQRCIIGYSPLAITGWPIAVVIPEHEFLKPVLNFLLKVIGLAVFALILALIGIRVVTHSIMHPLVSLSRLVGRIGEGDLSTVLPTASRKDEVASLVNAVSNMQSHLKQYIRDLENETALSSRLKGEMDAATRIQMAMLPGEGEYHYDSKDYQLYAKLEPAKSVGGDLYFCHELDDHRSYFVIGDVSDKGVPAALFMSKTMTVLTHLVRRAISPNELMYEVNNVLTQNNDACMFLTLWCGILDHKTGELVFASGGHMAPLLLRQTAIDPSDVQPETKLFVPIEQENGMALGLVDDMEFPINQLMLQPNDLLFLYTDGIDEAMNPERHFFGIDRMRQVLLQMSEMNACVAGTSMYQSVKEFAGEATQSDDITIMAIHMSASAMETYDFLIPEDMGQMMAAQCELSPKSSSVSALFSFLDAYWERYALSDGISFDVKLAAEELLSNSLNHGQLGDDDCITLWVGHCEQQVYVELIDEGKAFNPLKEADCSALGQSSEDCTVGGLGVHLVKEVTDQQKYQRDGNKNRICFSKTIM